MKFRSFGRVFGGHQSVLNTAERLIYTSRKFDHVTPLLHDLHWLRIPEGITFRLAVLAYRCQNVLAPQYLADDLHQVAEVESRRRLRSAATAALIVPATARSTIGDRAFSVTAARTWNSLPLSVTSSSSLPVFRMHLKTVLFTRSFPSYQHFSTFYIVTLFHSAVLRVFYYVH